MNPDAIEVCIDWQGHAFPVGTLYAAVASESVVFEYQPEWLAQVGAFAVDPVALPLAPGRFHAVRLFGAFADAGPDRWGRMLIERAVRQGMLDRRPYRAVDFLLAVDDVARIGAIRFRRAGERAFLGSGNGVIPPLVRLRELLAATDAVHDEKATARDLRFLLGAGSPLGGARPKCLVTLPDGRLAIAKFPKPDDTRDIAAGEVLGLAVGRAAGIKTADHQLARIGGRSVAIITRFDRRQEGRIPFLSAVSLLGLLADDAGSYTRLADGIRAHGDQVAADLEQLWRRVVYSIMANNYDDHMRNHGFLMHSAGVWALSPAYDINPTPAIDRARQPKTPVNDEAHASADALEAIEAAVASADRFGLKPAAARRIVAEVRSAVRPTPSRRKTIRGVLLNAARKGSLRADVSAGFLQQASMFSAAGSRARLSGIHAQESRNDDDLSTPPLAGDWLTCGGFRRRGIALRKRNRVAGVIAAPAGWPGADQPR